MVAKAIRGQGIAHTPGAGGSGCAASARFQENPATSGHAPQEVLNAGVVGPIRWSEQVFDNLGFPPDWGHDGTGEFLFPVSGYYLIVAYFQVEPLPCEFFSAGHFEVVLEPTFLDPLDSWWEQVSGAITEDPGTKVSLSAVHRIDLDANPGAGFWIDIHSYNVTGDGYVSRATISITRLCDLLSDV